MLGRAKSCQWQVFVRRRPPKQGELRTDVSKATMFQGDRAAKDLIGLVQSFGLSVLIRGLQNLDSPCKGTVLFFSLVRKEPKVPQRFANLWTPGTIQISARFVAVVKVTGVHQVTGCAGNCKLSGYRR